jgi:hypothetical protein
MRVYMANRGVWDRVVARADGVGCSQGEDVDLYVDVFRDLLAGRCVAQVEAVPSTSPVFIRFTLVRRAFGPGS